MDFWSRLIARASFAPVDKASSNNPEKRLARFKKEYNQLLVNTRLNTSQSTRDNEEAEKIRSGLQELTNILSDESRRPIPHPCITFASVEKIYTQISKIAIQSQHEGIIREGVAIFSTLIESEEEDFVKNNDFSKSLMKLLVEITGANSIRLGLDTEVEVVELSFNITTKIRLDPEILPVWFTSQPPSEIQTKEYDPLEAFAGKTHKEDFPLFYLLIDYIHHEGRIGDFARTGLLYIIEAASNSVALEQWIVESDLATLMATGLGALYSQLSRKLVIEHPDGQLPPILALSDYQKPHTNSEIIGSSSPDFQMHMETFLSHLLFWQDVLNHCKSTEVKQTLLEHFQVIFLKQLLYPSLLESSDLDGGSSVAVLTYLRRILEVLDHPDMIHLILHYLLALPDIVPPSSSRASISAARQRKSMDLATMMATKIEADSTPALFNLVDLIQSCLTSPNKETISVTLQLVSVILKRHHRYAVPTLLQTSQILSDQPPRKVGAHDKVMEFLLGVAEEIGLNQNHDKIYENYLKDCMNTLESHTCSINMICSNLSGGNLKFPGSNATIPGAPRDVRLHTLRPDDHVFEIILDILKKFLSNSVEVNLALTGAIIDLAGCGYTRIDGWLLPDPSKYVYEEDQNNASKSQYALRASDDIFEIQEKLQMQSMKLARRRPIWEKSQIPAFLHEIATITEQVALCKVEIPRFEDLLHQRREAFLVTSSTFLKPTPLRKIELGASPNLNAFDTFAQRIFPEFVTPTKSKLSRGRKFPDRHSSPGIGLGSETSGEIHTPGSFPHFSVGSESSSINEHSEDTSQQNLILEVQAANFTAADQSIMATKVSLPLVSGSVNFPNLPKKNEEIGSVDDQSDSSRDQDKLDDDEREKRMVSVNHILTNVIIFQDFLLELAALVQVRATLFREVSYT